MRIIVKRPRAGKDLKDIWCHTSRKDMRAGYYSLNVNRHVVYYVLTPSLIRIIRVLHARMDPDLHL